MIMASQRFSFATNTNTFAWLALMLATGVSWWFGHAVRGAQGNISAEVVGIIGAGAIKVWIVGFQFMEIRTAPKLLQIAFSAWLVAVSIALAVICTR